jgi:hypothetical protein
MSKTDTIQETTTIQLSKTLKIDGIETSVLSMREPTVADQLAADKLAGTDAEKEVSMIAMLCMVKPQDLHAMKMKDYKKLQAAFLSFFG